MGSIKGGLSPNMTVSLRGTEIQTQRHTKRRQEGSSNHGVEGQEGGGCHGVKQKEGSGRHGVKAQERDSCLQVLERGLERNQPCWYLISMSSPQNYKEINTLFWPPR